MPTRANGENDNRLALWAIATKPNLWKGLMKAAKFVPGELSVPIHVKLLHLNEADGWDHQAATNLSGAFVKWACYRFDDVGNRLRISSMNHFNKKDEFVFVNEAVLVLVKHEEAEFQYLDLRQPPQPQ